MMRLEGGAPRGGLNSFFLAGPDGRNRSATFGTISSARDARVMQFGLKVIFQLKAVFY